MESKSRYELEFPINSSPQLLYQYISTPSGLSEWFADNVNSRGEYFTFIWDDSGAVTSTFVACTLEEINDSSTTTKVTTGI